MTLRYYPETDSLYIELRPEPGVETVEIAEGLLADLDASGRVVGFDVDHASSDLDLARRGIVDHLPSTPEPPEETDAPEKA